MQPAKLVAVHIGGDVSSDLLDYCILPSPFCVLTARD